MKNKKVSVEVSARHIHLCQEDLDKLFGKDYKLNVKKELSQKGEFAAEETVALVGPKNKIDNLRIVGPVRKRTQVELSATGSFKVGIQAPLRLSGDLEGSASAKIVGPGGEVELEEGVIVAKRHIHINSTEAQELNLKDGDVVKVEIKGERGLVFNNVLVRIKDTFQKSIHIDTDEANAAGLGAVCGEGELVLE